MLTVPSKSPHPASLRRGFSLRGRSTNPSSFIFSRTSSSSRQRKLAVCATVRPWAISFLRSLMSILDQGLPEFASIVVVCLVGATSHECRTTLPVPRERAGRRHSLMRVCPRKPNPTSITGSGDPCSRLCGTRAYGRLSLRTLRPPRCGGRRKRIGGNDAEPIFAWESVPGSTVRPQEPAWSKCAPCLIEWFSLVRLNFARPTAGILRNDACILLR